MLWLVPATRDGFHVVYTCVEENDYLTAFCFLFFQFVVVPFCLSF